jgi:hypothetical protein
MPPRVPALTAEARSARRHPESQAQEPALVSEPEPASALEQAPVRERGQAQAQEPVSAPGPVPAREQVRVQEPVQALRKYPAQQKWAGTLPAPRLPHKQSRHKGVTNTTGPARWRQGDIGCRYAWVILGKSPAAKRRHNCPARAFLRGGWLRMNPLIDGDAEGFLKVAQPFLDAGWERF